MSPQAGTNIISGQFFMIFENRSRSSPLEPVDVPLFFFLPYLYRGDAATQAYNSSRVIGTLEL